MHVHLNDAKECLKSLTIDKPDCCHGDREEAVLLHRDLHQDSSEDEEDQDED